MNYRPGDLTDSLYIVTSIYWSEELDLVIGAEETLVAIQMMSSSVATR